MLDPGAAEAGGGRASAFPVELRPVPAEAGRGLDAAEFDTVLW